MRVLPKLDPPEARQNFRRPGLWLSSFDKSCFERRAAVVQQPKKTSVLLLLIGRAYFALDARAGSGHCALRATCAYNSPSQLH